MVQKFLRVMVTSTYDDINLLTTTSPRLTAEERLFQHVNKTTLLVQLKSALSPVKELPFEILSAIFSHCITGTSKLPLQRSSVPWNLTHVSSTWRAVALQVPNLWNDISISFSSDRPQEFTRITNMLEAFLSRTNKTPISLEILAEHIQSSPLNPPDALCHSIENIVRPYAGRLRHLFLRPPDQFKALFGHPQHALEVLESVSLNIANLAVGFDAITAGIMIPGDAHNLRKITISTESASLDLHSLQFPWAGLTELRILNTVVTYTGCHAALRQCPNLVTFTLGMVPEDRTCLDQIPSTRLRHLKSLTIMARYADGNYGLFLRPFILWSLKEFTITGGPWAEWLGISSLIARSSCRLERFEAVEFHTPETLEFLLKVPSLTKLSLRQCSQNYAISSLDDLTISDSTVYDRDLLPNLRGIECNLDDVKPLIYLLELRSQSVAVTSIQSWTIHGDPEKARQIIGKSTHKFAREMDIIYKGVTT